MPVQRFRAVLGVLLLSTQAGDIDNIVHAERLAIMRVFGVATLVNVLLSLVLSSTIANPLRRLSAAAIRVRRGAKEREEIAIISAYLPQQMSEDETKSAIAAEIAATGAAGMKDMGKVIAALKAKYAGQMDFGKASGLVKAALNG